MRKSSWLLCLLFICLGATAYCLYQAVYLNNGSLFDYSVAIAGGIAGGVYIGITYALGKFFEKTQGRAMTSEEEARVLDEVL